MKRKAFTLVELIVVITILAILGTISFISLSGYFKASRDAKRLADTTGLLNKINIENGKGTPLNKLIKDGEIVTLQILGKKNTNVQTFRKIDFEVLGENEENFKDPSNKNQNYPIAYALGGKGKGKYRFIQIATISEKENRAVIKGNYYRSKNNEYDALSLFMTGGIVLENGGEKLPYPPTSGENTGGGNTSGGGGQKFSCTGALPNNIETFNTDNLTVDIAYQNTNESQKCYYKCIENYEWNENKTECREIIILPNNCETTTIEQYPLEAKNHSEIQLVSKSGANLENGTQILEQSFICDDGVFKKEGEENIKNICNFGFVWDGNQCKADLCKGVIPENSESTATSQSINNSWTHNDTPGICTFKCKVGSTWNGSSCVISHIGEVEVWVDPSTGFIRQAKPTEKLYKWANAKGYSEPIWDSKVKDYIYPTGRSSDYPAFQGCIDLGDGWRLPTKNELTLLVDYEKKNPLKAYSKHEGISSYHYRSSGTYTRKTKGWSVHFDKATTVGRDKTYNNYIVCIHDSSPKIAKWVHNPDIGTVERFGNTTYNMYGIEAYRDSHLGGKYWEINPSYKTWEQAEEYCSNLGTGGWRIPTIEEIYSLATYETKNTLNAYSNHPLISPHTYWSSTIYNIDNVSVLSVFFEDTTINSAARNTYHSYFICIHD